MPDINVSPLDLHFVADQVGQLDVLLRFIIDSVRTAEDFKAFQKTLNETLKEVKITRVIAVDDWLKDQTAGYVVLVRPKGPEVFIPEWADANPVDYWRDEEALPIVFQDKKTVYEAIPDTYDILNIINLAEKHEDKK